MTKNLVDETFSKEAVVEPSVRCLVRTISTTSVPIGESSPFFALNAEIGELVDGGYRIVNTHYMGTDIEGVHILFILSK